MLAGDRKEGKAITDVGRCYSVAPIQLPSFSEVGHLHEASMISAHISTL